MEKYLTPIVEHINEEDFDDYDPDFICIQYDVVENMQQNNTNIEAIKPIIKLMENNPLVDFGTPGPLTHFIEKLQKGHEKLYDEWVVSSIKSNPAIHTIHLLQRIINSSNKQKAALHIQFLKSIHDSEKVNETIKATIKDLLDYYQ